MDGPSELVRRVRAGAPGAAEELARRAGTSALRTATAVLRDSDLARDVAQNVALDALRGIHRLHDPERLDAWIHRIAVRRTSGVARERSRRRGVEISLADLDGSIEPSAEGDPAMDADVLALRQALLRGLEALPTRQRVALALRYVHDLTEPEIAEVMGCRPGTAASLLSRGREALRHSPLVRDLAPTRSGGTP